MFLEEFPFIGSGDLCTLVTTQQGPSFEVNNGEELKDTASCLLCFPAGTGRDEEVGQAWGRGSSLGQGSAGCVFRR